ncbi:MAG: hypothetical protein M3071_04825, partial [Actinomycetota bacterium]|nr:hypothetical protein [Actinomycetota bacterium]
AHVCALRAARRAWRRLPPRSAGARRVLPNGDGSEYLFPLFFAFGTGNAAVTQQMAVVEEELNTVRVLCAA